MAKKVYGKPLMFAEEFVPQEYIAACSADEDFVTYQFWCDASISGWFGDYALHVYFDNGDGLIRHVVLLMMLPFLKDKV